MNWLKNNRGSTTIYLVIVFFAVMVFIGLMIDLGRIRIAENQLRRASNASARSLLADYDTGIKDQYGLFVTKPINDPQGAFKKYMMVNLSHGPSQNIDLLDYRYENSDIYYFRALDNPKVLKQQILEEMKYRAPVQLSIEIFQRLKSLGGIFNQMNKAQKDQQSLVNLRTKLQNIKDNNKKIKTNNEKHKKLRIKIEQQEEDLDSMLDADEPDYEAISSLRSKIKSNKKKMKNIESDTKDLSEKITRDRDDMQRELDTMKSNQGDTSLNEQESSDNKDDIDQGVVADSEKAEAERQKFIDDCEKRIGGLLDDANCTDAVLDDITGSSGMSFEDACDQLGQLPANASPTGEDGSDPNNPEQKGTLTGILENAMPSMSRGYSAGGSGGTSGDALIKAKSIFDLVNIGNLAIKFRDELYINEFVLSKREDHLRFENLATSHFEKYDQEYIICGSPQAALGEVWLIRFALDTPAYYIWVFQPAGPFYGLIASAVVGAIQATIDVVILTNPDNVALKKYGGKVKLMNVMVKTIRPMPPLPEFDYKDHLRILALMNRGDGKLERTAERIGANCGVDIHQATTAVYGNTTVSIRLWFLPLAGFRNMDNGPFGTKIKDGRCYITKEVQYAY
ncbi:MAG: TadE/TadG family type IV pilus assembly protein [Ignavibacteriales bacterium]